VRERSSSRISREGRPLAPRPAPAQVFTVVVPPVVAERLGFVRLALSATIEGGCALVPAYCFGTVDTYE
jgi:hypothetical protein